MVRRDFLAAQSVNLSSCLLGSSIAFMSAMNSALVPSLCLLAPVIELFNRGEGEKGLDELKQHVDSFFKVIGTKANDNKPWSDVRLAMGTQWLQPSSQCFVRQLLAKIQPILCSVRNTRAKSECPDNSRK
jgi:hypothetical protein